MHEHSLSHLSDPALTRALKECVREERGATNKVLAHIAEFDDRQLYRAAGSPSMYVYCVEELHLAEYAALKRIRAARAIRRFPQLAHVLADGRLHLSGLALLAAHLTAENVDELVSACTHRSKKWIEKLVAERFPRRDMPERVRLMVGSQLAPGPVVPVPASTEAPLPLETADGGEEASAPPPVQLAPGPVAPTPLPRVTPLSPNRYGVQATVDEATYDKLRIAHELLGLPFGSGRIAAVLDQALDALIERLERRKFAATPNPKPARAATDPRTIPAAVKRAVRARDGGRCTYVGDNGRR